MERQGTRGGRTKCPECGGMADPADWLPSTGNDPMMRQFVCLSCHAEFFYIVPDGAQLMLVRERIAALREAGELQNDLSKTG